MTSKKTRLDAAKRHGTRALSELRHLSADAALYWVLSHKARVAQFRRSVRGTPAESVVERLLGYIKDESTVLDAPRRRARRPRATAPRKAPIRRHIRIARTPDWLKALASQPFPLI